VRGTAAGLRIGTLDRPGEVYRRQLRPGRKVTPLRPGIAAHWTASGERLVRCLKTPSRAGGSRPARHVTAEVILTRAVNAGGSNTSHSPEWALRDGALTVTDIVSPFFTGLTRDAQASNLGGMVNYPGRCGADPRTGVFGSNGGRDDTRRSERSRLAYPPGPRRGGCHRLSSRSQAPGTQAD